ncbi:MAG TPA: alpha-L-fucosidase [Candidatus Binatia bacterium]
MRPALAAAALNPFILAALLTACSDAPSAGVDVDAPTLCTAATATADQPARAASAASATTSDALASTRPLPAWYDDAKLGIMIHWGVWTIPGFAETTLDPERVADPNDPDYLLAPGGIERFLRHNPYTEWYENSLAIDGTATQAFHHATYGADFPYTGFAPLFEEASAPWQADDWADLFARARARYVVFVSKHHDGYALWPTSVANPRRPGWSSSRDYAGELADAVRERCQRFGVYYSGGIDWSFSPPPIQNAVEFLLSTPTDADYARYVEDQYRDLIARYQPAVLWNDIGSPVLTDEARLFADYYAAVPDGVVNDRWGLDPSLPPADFRSVEYDVRDEISPDKWEAVRGIGRAFGWNANQREEDYGTPEKYVHLLIDTVSKNGNLLLNVGPMADGTIPAPQVRILRALGAWLERYGEAIFATRPWTRFRGETEQGIDARFTQSRDGSVVYATLLGTPAGTSVTLRDFAPTPAAVRFARGDGADAGTRDDGEPLTWRRDGADLVIELPAVLDAQPAHALAIELG